LWISSSGYAVYGDLNGDGFDDFVTSDSDANYENGQVGICLGGQNANATYDLIMNPPSEHQFRNFGYAKAIGDFDGDGYDDLAISCPWWIGFGAYGMGRVLIYSGNAQLQDTTVANDDPAAPEQNTSDWRFNIYPNPFYAKAGEIRVTLLGTGYNKAGRYTYSVKNIRGQIVRQDIISEQELRDAGFDVRVSQLSSGIYILTISDQYQILASRKVVIYK
jgi:hypothetical protein